MNKLTLAVLLASTVIISACGGGGDAVGTSAQVHSVTEAYHAKMEEAGH